MASGLEGKFVAFELDSSLFCSGSSLILFSAAGGKLHEEYDPRNQNVPLDSGIDNIIREYLQKKGANEVYTPREIVHMPESILDLALNFDSEREWGQYLPLGSQYWKEFFAEAGITLREFDATTLEELP